MYAVVIKEREISLSSSRLDVLTSRTKEGAIEKYRKYLHKCNDIYDMVCEDVDGWIDEEVIVFEPKINDYILYSWERGDIDVDAEIVEVNTSLTPTF